MNDKSPGSAVIDIVECTTKVQRFDHPELAHVKFWDVPGAGTNRFPADVYFWKVKVYAFDFLLIMSSEQFKKIDFDIGLELHKYKVPFAFVRTKADVGIRNLQ